ILCSLAADLNPPDFYLQRLLKFLVYEISIVNEDMLRQLIFDACNTIRNCFGIFERVRQSMIQCVQACIESNGRHFKHLL
ncbi:hypothetical protein ALC57_00256, partial [Trachymyrmex cornetzi]